MTTDAGRLEQNIIHFCRALRRAGVPVGPAQTLDAIRAVEATGFAQRSDFYTTLRACLITRMEHLDIFDRLFHMFWRDPEFLDKMMSMMLPALQRESEAKTTKAARKRAAESLVDGAPQPVPPREQDEELQVDAQFTTSADERLKSMDFEQMSNAEMAEAKTALTQMTLPITPLQSRRLRPANTGRLMDARATFRQMMRQGGEITRLPRKTPKQRYPDLVALCDISGSCSVYARMFMHFLHSVSRTKGAGWARVHGFTFGTRLTNITRNLNLRDPDAALEAVGQQAQDWDGGTRIGACLEEFNRHWSRRVLSRGAVVLLITDGLERDGLDNLAKQAERLQLSAKQVIWLNPLLRWDGFSPLAQGIRRLLPLVDSFHSCHNLESLHDLAGALSGDGQGEKQRMMRML